MELIYYIFLFSFASLVIGVIANNDRRNTLTTIFGRGLIILTFVCLIIFLGIFLANNYESIRIFLDSSKF